jgi:hypothetical protein
MRIWLALAALALTSCSAAHATNESPRDNTSAGAAAPAAPNPVPERQPVEVEMGNVDLRVTDNIILGVRHLRGRFVPADRSDMPYLDDKLSYTVAIDSAEIALDMASLNALMMRTLGGDRSNVKKVKVSVDDHHQLRQQGVLTKGIPVPFDVKGAIEATPDGRIKIHAASVRGFGLPVNPLMKMLSLEMDDLLKVKAGAGVTVDKNDLILDPQQIVPPPFIRGKVTAVRLEGDRLVQSFGSRDWQRLSPPAVSPNHIYWRGGELQFGKLTMAETDLELVDDDPRDPFDFSVDHWNDQLVAGYSKNTPGKGLKAHMPDYNDLKK